MVKRGKKMLVAGLAVALTVTVMQPAAAHSPWSGYYTMKWRTEWNHRHCTLLILCSDHLHKDKVFHWTYGSGWDSTLQNDIIAVQGQWDGNETIEYFDFDFEYQEWESRSSNPCKNASMANIHRFAYIDGDGGTNTAGQISRCVTDDGSSVPKLWSFVITYDSGQVWHFGSGSPSSSETDFRSIVSHELGHATGFNHFTDGSSVCPTPWSNTSRATMCPGTSDGSTWQRSTELHDDHTFQGAYGGTPT